MSFWGGVVKIVGAVVILNGRANQQRSSGIQSEGPSYTDHSISCRKCDGLAGPIKGTKRNYRCSCGHQFSGPNHPF